MEPVLACGITVKNFQSAGSTFPVDFTQKKHLNKYQKCYSKKIIIIINEKKCKSRISAGEFESSDV